MVKHHVLLVTFPGQGHINPSLQLAKSLAKHRIKVTFFTSQSVINLMNRSSLINALIDFVSFSHDIVGDPNNFKDFMSSLRTQGSKAMEQIMAAKREEGNPVTNVIYNLLVPWAGQVAHRLQVPLTLLWIQSTVLFDIYFYYFNKYFESTGKNEVIHLPGLPPLEPSDLPSYLLPSNLSVYDFALQTYAENFEILDRENYPTILVNTFEALEFEPLKIIEKYKLMAIGPLIPSAFLDGEDPSDTSFGGDLVQKSVDYIQFLDSKEKLSVIYVAFGSSSQFSKPQMEEIAKGLLESKRPFLWVIRCAENSEKLDEILSCREELEKRGKIVPWCTQVEVLSHPSVGCYMTHCGWNSTLESLASGIPIVGFPQWTDQITNAKLVQDYWRSGVRLRRSEDGVVGSGEIKRCLQSVMGSGERDKEMIREAKKWRDLAKDAMKEDGSSSVNLKSFMDEVVGRHHETLDS